MYRILRFLCIFMQFLCKDVLLKRKKKMLRLNRNDIFALNKYENNRKNSINYL